MCAPAAIGAVVGGLLAAGGAAAAGTAALATVGLTVGTAAIGGSLLGMSVGSNIDAKRQAKDLEDSLKPKSMKDIAEPKAPAVDSASALSRRKAAAMMGIAGTVKAGRLAQADTSRKNLLGQ